MIDTGVHLALPPPAAPRPRATRRQPAPVRRSGEAARSRPRIRCECGSPATRSRRCRARGSSGPRAARSDVLPIESRLSTGLARPDLYNWFTRFRQVIGQLHPNVAVLSFGADDAHDYLAGVPVGRIVGPLGSPSWSAEYRRRVDGVTRELNAAGIYVAWLGLPIPDGAGFKKSFPVVNAVLEQVVRAHPRTAAYIDTWHLLDDAHGRYAPYLRVHGRLILMRLPDGVHYTAAAGDLIAQNVLAKLRGLPDRELVDFDAGRSRRRAARAGESRAPPPLALLHRRRDRLQLRLQSSGRASALRPCRRDPIRRSPSQLRRWRAPSASSRRPRSGAARSACSRSTTCSSTPGVQRCMYRCSSTVLTTPSIQP